MFCSKCGRENKDDANFCQHCGARLGQSITVQVSEKTPRTGRVFWIVGIIAAVLVIFAIVVPFGICLMIGHTLVEETEALEVVNSSMPYDEFGYAEVTGRVRNTGDSEIRSYFIAAKFYDSEDTVIDTGSDFLSYLGPGEQAQFTILCNKKGAVRYELSVGG